LLLKSTLKQFVLQVHMQNCRSSKNVPVSMFEHS